MDHKPQQGENYELPVEKHTQEEKTPEQQQKERYEALVANSKKMKKRILWIMAGVAAAILLMIGCILLIQSINAGNEGNGQAPDLNITFHEPYEGNIMENKDYLALNRWVYYCDDPYGYGVTTAITEENRDGFDSGVLFLYNYIQTIIAGDHEAYNDCFNDAYFRKADPKDAFYPQMLYDIKILFYMRESADLVTYRLEYKIHRNDGTFRRDVESDASRYQLVTLRISDDGEISIERLITPHSTKR